MVGFFFCTALLFLQFVVGLVAKDVYLTVHATYLSIYIAYLHTHIYYTYTATYINIYILI